MALLILAVFTSPGAPSIKAGDRSESDNAEYRYEGSYKPGEGFAFVSSRQNNGRNPAADYPKNDDAETLNATEADLLAQERVAHWTLWIGVFTAAGLIALIFAFDETRAATNATREIGENQTKAYVNVSEVRVDRVTVDGRFLLTHIDTFLSNTGATPAVDILVGGEMIIYEKSFTTLGNNREICREEIWPDTVVDLPPNNEPLMVTFALPPSVENEMKQAGFNALASIYLRIEGEIQYWDVFKNRYLTQFIFESLIEKGEAFPGMFRSSKQVECYKKIESKP
ncbi:MAG: hypothetical protein RH945_06735 [Hyphomonas sp.]